MEWNFGNYLTDLFSPAESDRVFNSAEAQKQRDWEENMSNSAHQRAVADMKAAGLNPAMMYSSGASGASTPTNSPASVSSSSSGGSLLNAAVKIGQLIAGVALKNPKVATMGFGSDLTSASKRQRYS